MVYVNISRESHAIMKYCMVCMKDMCVYECRVEYLFVEVKNNLSARDASTRGTRAKCPNLPFDTFSLNIQVPIILQLLHLFSLKCFFLLTCC